MNWQVRPPEPGDIVRIKLSEIYHYGIYVSDTEVIQFGLPPDASRHIDDADVQVLATDIDRFRMGGFPETAVLSPAEKLKRYPPRKTVRMARERIGEKGYHLLSNNCEHFVYECVFGKKYCSQTDDIRETIRNLPLVDVYLCLVPANESDDAHSQNAEAQLSKWASHLIAYSLERSFGVKAEMSVTVHDGYADMSAAGCFISFHTCQRMAACVVSRKGAYIALDAEKITEQTIKRSLQEYTENQKKTVSDRYRAQFPDDDSAALIEKRLDDADVSITLSCTRGSLVRYYSVTETTGSFVSKMIKL